MLLKSRLPVLLGATAVCVAAAVGVAVDRSADCPPGFQPRGEEGEAAASSVLERAAAALSGQTCVFAKHPEPPHELMRMNDQFLETWGPMPEGALRLAVRQKEAMVTQNVAASVPNADGVWEEFGRGTLVTDDPRYPSVNGLGIGFNSGRVDSFDYDATNGRLFASVGTGGVWMSTDLGENWVNIGDGLPTLIIGSVAWTPAGGGTLIAGSGEPLNGGFTFVGMGAFWTDDLGVTWNEAAGVPDGAMTYQVEVDPGHPEIVYVATSKGLYRSADAGRTYVNVVLPTTCSDLNNKACQFANWVTDVVVKEPGGSENVVCNASGCPVLAAVGYRSGKKLYSDGTTQHSPGNGLYRSDTGQAGSFAKLAVFGDGVTPVGFATEERVGRTELGNATGPGQDHNYVYAVVQDAVLLNGGVGRVDVPDEGLTGPAANNTVFNGVYVSPDFGTSWVRMADENELANPSSGSSLTTVSAAASSYAPGIQAWYNLYVRVDPTRQDLNGVPTRIVFGLEEIWTNRTPNVALDGIGQQGTNDFRVIGTYFSGTSCQFLNTGAPYCPTNDPPTTQTTTHPDQQDALFVPDGTGGVYLFAGNDGGVYRQRAAAGAEFSNDKWGFGHNDGFYTLLNYGIGVAKDCTVWFGLQDNGSGRIQPDNRAIYETYGGDGGMSAVDPANSAVAYTETPGGSLRRTLDGGSSWTTIKPSQITRPRFINPFVLDPTDAKHIMTGGPQIVENLNAPAATTGNWTQVFNLGTAPSGALRDMTAVDLHGDAAYVGFCGLCNIATRTTANATQPFANGIATNVGGSLPAKRGTSDGWHFANATGLPNRYITAIEIDPATPSTVYVSLSGYSNAQWAPPGQFLDTNTNIGAGHVFKSVNAGESFVDVSGNLPDVPVFWIVLRGNQLIAGTQVGAFISSDTDGTLWAPMGSNMPNVPIMQLETFLGDMTHMFASTFGRGIWRYRFPGQDDICPIPVGELIAAAPVQLAPAGVDSVGADPACSLDSDGSYTLNFSYTLPSGGNEPVGFQVQEATLFEMRFDDDADGQLSGGSNTKWAGTAGWQSSVNPTTGSPSYYVPALMDQDERLEMIDAVPLLEGGGTLSFDTTYDTEACCDFANVEISADGGASWDSLARFSGTDFGPQQYDLSPYGGQSVKIRFRLSSDPLVPGGGWFVENIRIDTNNFTTVGTVLPDATSFDRTRGAGTWFYRVAGLFTSGIDTVAGPSSNVKCVTVDAPNLAPVANAGVDFAIDEGGGVLLSGSASSDPEGGTLAYAWTQTAGPTVTLSGAGTATATFTAPNVNADTALTFELEVTDEGTLSATDTVTVTVRDVTGGVVPVPVAGIGDNKVGGLPPLTLLLATLLALGRRRARR
jgi:hypothetical protein